MESTSRVQQTIASCRAGRPDPLKMLEYEACRIYFGQINGVQHARRIVARLKYVVNGKPTVSSGLPLGVPQLNVNCAVAVSNRERATRLDRAMGERFDPKKFVMQTIAVWPRSDVSAKHEGEVVNRYLL